ncbi:hypothetical protein GOV11_03395 [Candidatus Woesearchaeota archaeon]|nr:hypothetical protein [Candidatus Woesearchaeota archaeon]
MGDYNDIAETTFHDEGKEVRETVLLHQMRNEHDGSDMRFVIHSKTRYFSDNDLTQNSTNLQVLYGVKSLWINGGYLISEMDEPNRYMARGESVTDFVRRLTFVSWTPKHIRTDRDEAKEALENIANTALEVYKNL